MRPRTPEELAAQATAIHGSALAQPPATRWAWVADLCAGDPELRAAVELRLIGALTTPGLSLGLTPLPGAPATTTTEFAPGALIDGRYRVMHRIGEGGLGVVFLAQQETPVQRKVALKVLHAGLESQNAIARFEAEIAALSRMNHPNVAAIHDAGRTPGGRMYVVMEFIDGDPLDIFVSNHRLDLEPLLRVFIRICRGVHHAHQRGIIHRDLKPMNILVRDDDEPLPRIIDFGIARATLDASAQQPRLTVAGMHVGTPEYMSPEQAGVLEAEADTASDVYSLGVILYELLTGTLPLSFEGRREPAQWRRVFDDTRIAPPSARLRQHPRSDTRPWPAHRIVGDLDAIVMQALAREPDRRYASAAELAADVERHLTGIPVVARAPGVFYVLGRAIKRRPGLLVGAAVAIVGLVAAFFLVANAAAESEAQRRQAESAIADAEAQRVIAAQQAAHAERLLARSSTVAAVTALSLDEGPAILTNLASVAPAHRGWGWHLLETAATPWLEHHAIGEGRTLAMTIAPDDAWLALGGEDGTARIFATASGRIVQTLQVGSLPVLDVAIAPDGGSLLASDREQNLVLFDLPSGTARWRTQRPHRITSAAFAAIDGKTTILATISDPTEASNRPSYRMAFLDPASGSLIRTFGPNLAAPEPAWFCPDTPAAPVLLATGNTATGAFTPAGDLLWTAPGRIEAIPTGPCDRYVALDPDQRESRAIRATIDGRLLKEGRATRGLWQMTGLGPDGFLAWHEGNSAIVIEDVTGALPPVRLAGHGARVRVIAFEHRGPHLYSADEVGRLIRWRRDTLPNPETLAAGFGLTMAGTITSDVRMFVAASWGFLRAFDADTVAPAWHRFLGRAYITAIDVLPGDKEMVTADWRGNVWLLASDDGRTLAEATIPDTTIIAIRATTSDMFAAATSDGELIGLRILGKTGFRKIDVVWRRRFHDSLPWVNLAASPDGRLLAAAIGNPVRIPEGGGPLSRRQLTARTVPPEHGAIVIDARTGNDHLQLEQSRTMWLGIAFTPDAKALIGGADDGTVTRWSYPEGAVTGRRAGIGGRVQAFAFPGDWAPSDPTRPTRGPARILMALDTGHITLWDATSDDYLFTLPTPAPDPLAMRLGPDGNHLGIIGARLQYHRFQIDPAADPAARHHHARLMAAARRALDAHIDPATAAAHVDDFLPDAIRTAPADRAAVIARILAWGRNPNELNSRAWGRALHAETFAALDAPERARVRMMAETAASIDERAEFENTRALVRLRMGDFDGAITAANRSTELLRQRDRNSSPADRAIIAMALWHLGNRQAARSELASGHTEAAEPVWSGDPDTRSLLLEASALITD